MSTESQHKLYYYEEIPPSNIWDKISTDLDDAALEYKFPLKLKEYSVIPPQIVWEKINSQLDELELIGDYSEKLYDLEIDPPKGTWAKINSVLPGDVTNTNHVRKNVFPILRYAAAAAFIGILAWGGIKLFQTRERQGEISLEETGLSGKLTLPTKNEQAIKDIKESAIADIIAETDEARNDAALEASKKTYAKLDIRTNKKIKEVANFYFGEPDITGITRNIDINNPQPIYNPGLVDNDANRYFLLMTPDGNIIRMSKKLAGMVCCVSGEEQDEQCKDQLKKWKAKMANTQTGHSPGNFMDIISLLNSLQEEK